MHLVFMAIFFIAFFVMTVNEKEFRFKAFRYLFIFFTSLTYLATFYLVYQVENKVSEQRFFPCK